MLEVEKLVGTPSLELSMIHAINNTGNEWRLAEGYILWRLKRFDDLSALLLSLPKSCHSDAQFWLLTGLVCSVRPNQLENVIFAYKKAIEIAPDRPDLYYNLANAVQSKDPFSSIDFYCTSILLDSFQPHCWHNLARLYQDLNHSQLALSLLSTSIKLNPFDIDCLCNLGLAFMSLGSFEAAERTFLHAISLDSNLSKSHINLGVLFLSSRRLEEALSELEYGLTLDPNSSSCLFNLSLCYLLLGRFSIGWTYYQYRFESEVVPSSSFPTSGPLIHSLIDLNVSNESPLIVWAEQGLGDAIQFCRYLNQILCLGIPFEFHCSPLLFRLIHYWFDSNIILRELLPSSDCTDLRPHCPLLSLPYLFHTDEFSIPSTLPYLKPSFPVPHHLVIDTPPGGLSVGLVWASNPDNQRMYKNKSFPLQILMPLLLKLTDLDLISLHSLQVGNDRHQLAPWIDHPFITDWSTHLTDFCDTASVVNQLDLVISVDTAVAHLSGALQRSTWLLLPWDSDFRWMRDRDDSPWYPEVVRLFRQTSPNDWPSVVSAVQKAFERLFMIDISSVANAKIVS